MVLVATEDRLSDAVASKIVFAALGTDVHVRSIVKNGNGNLRKGLHSLVEASKTYPVVMLTDLDHLACAPMLVANWTNGKVLPDRLKLRVAVREVEAWLLADRKGMSEFLKTSIAKISSRPEQIADPKRYLLQLAKSGPRKIKEDLLPSRGSIAIQGFGYNECLCKFVANDWSPERASGSSPSLKKAIERIQELGAAA
jgi:hypothetical protein